MVFNRNEYMKGWRKNNKEKEKEYRNKPKAIFKKRESSRKYLQRPETKLKIRTQLKKYYQNPSNLLKRRKYEKEYRNKNKEQIKEKQKEYNQSNKEKNNFRQRAYNQRPEVKERSKKYHKEYNKNNVEKIILRVRKYENNNKEKISETKRKYRERNKDKIRERLKEYNKRPEVITRKSKYKKERWKRDLNYALIERLRGLFFASFKYYSNTGKIMSSKKYGIDYKAIIEHLKPFPKNIKNYHIDHIVPLSMWDFNNPEHIKKAFLPENHQWLTINQNKWKFNRLVYPKFVEMRAK